MLLLIDRELKQRLWATSSTGREVFSLLTYSYFEKGWRKKCARQSRKVLWVVLSSLLYKEIRKNGTGGHGHDMFASAKGKQKIKVGSTGTVVRYSVMIISHITFRDCCVHFFCDSRSRSSCKRLEIVVLSSFIVKDKICQKMWVKPWPKDAKRPLQMTCFVQKRDQSINQSINQFINVNTWDGVVPIIRASPFVLTRCLHKKIRYNSVSAL